MSYQCLSSHAFVGSCWAFICCGFPMRVTHHNVTAQFAHTARASHSHPRPRPLSFFSSSPVPARYGAQAAAERASGESGDQFRSARTCLTDLRLPGPPFAWSRTEFQTAPTHGMHVPRHFTDDDGCAARLKRAEWRVRGVSLPVFGVRHTVRAKS